MRKASRIEKIPPYLFAEIDKKKEAALARGVDIISLGIGDPDLPTPGVIVEALCREAHDPVNHRYPDYEGSLAYRQALADWYRTRFGVELEPRTEVMALIGSKEGIAHIIWAYVDPGDYALVPDPAYPVYRTHTLLAGGIPYPMPLRAERGFLPDFREIPRDIARKARIMFLNYPNNPTAAVADLEFFREAVAFAREHDIVLCHDNAYAEMTFDGYVAPSLLQVEGARDLAVEFYSFSKPFNMTGWRIGACVGNREIVAALGIIKTNTDSGQFTAIQKAAIAGLQDRPTAFFQQMNEVYRRRRDLLVDSLNAMGWKVPRPRGSFYIWAPVPNGQTSAEFAGFLLEKAGVIVTPGSAYGQHGEGYVRMALTVPEERIAEALERIKQAI